MPSSEEMRLVSETGSPCCDSLVWAIGETRWCGKCQKPFSSPPENVVPAVHHVHDDDSAGSGA